MPTKILTKRILLPLLGFCLSGCSLLFPDYLPYTFKTTFVHHLSPREKMLFQDLDGDSLFEYIKIYYDYTKTGKEITTSHLVYLDGDFNTVGWQHNEIAEIGDMLPVKNSLPGTGGFPMNLLIMMRAGFSGRLALLNCGAEKEIWDREFWSCRDVDGDGYWHGEIFPYRTMDLTGDGQEEALVIAKAGYDLYPRGVWAIDLTNGDTLWTYPTGCWVEKIEPFDVNYDGREELVLATYAPANGASAGNTDDHHSYLIILETATGHPSYCQETGGIHSHCRVAVVKSQRKGSYLVTLIRSGAPGANFDRLCFWEGWPLQLSREISLNERYENIIAYDANRDGEKEVVIISNNGKVKAYDLSGKELATFQSEQSLKSPRNLAMADPLQQDVLLLNGGNNELIGLGKGLKVLFKIPEPEAKSLLPLESPRFAVVGASEVRLGYFVPTPLLIPYKELYVFGVGILVTLLALVWISRFRMPLRWQWLNQDLNLGLLWLNRKGGLKKFNRAGQELLPDLPNHLPQEIIKALEWMRQKKRDRTETEVIQGKEQFERQLRCRLRAFPQGVLVLVEDVTDAQRSKFLRAWAEGIGRIVHFFKSPASTIQLGLQQLRKSGPNEEILTRLEGQSELLIRYAQRFKKIFTLLELKLEPQDVNQLIRRILVAYLGSQSEQIHFDFTPEEETILVRADRDQMEILLRCLLDNAVEALGSEGQIRIRTRSLELVKGAGQAWVQKFAEIEIADNGLGMDSQTLEQALRPGFSTKEKGMGLGLPQAKLITELHGGEFEIRSQPGVGTTIHIKLPTLDTENEST